MKKKASGSNNLRFWDSSERHNIPRFLPNQSFNLLPQRLLRRLTKMHPNHISGIPNHLSKARLSVINLIIILFHLQPSNIS